MIDHVYQFFPAANYVVGINNTVEIVTVTIYPHTRTKLKNHELRLSHVFT
jgi:hypothetical protein